jgi:hypothetical protein
MVRETETIKRLREIGGDVYLKDGEVCYRIPSRSPERDGLLESLRKRKKPVRVALEHEAWDALAIASGPANDANLRRVLNHPIVAAFVKRFDAQVESVTIGSEPGLELPTKRCHYCKSWVF